MPIEYDFEWPEKCVDTNYYLIWWRNDSLKYIKHLVIIYNAMDCAEIEKKTQVIIELFGINHASA